MNSRFYIKIIFVNCERDFNAMLMNFANSDVYGSVSYVVSGSICSRRLGSNTKVILCPPFHFQHNFVQLDIDWVVRSVANFETICFFTDNTTDMAAFQSLIQLKDTFRMINSRRTMFLIFHFPTTTVENNKQFVQEIFQNITKAELRQYNFITYTSPSNTKLLLLEAHRRKLLNFPTQWILHITDKVDNITEAIKGIIQNNITCLALIYPQNDANNDEYIRHVKSLHNCLADHFTSVIEMASKVVYTSQYQFTISEEIQNVTRALDKLNCDFKYQWNAQTFAVGLNGKPIHTDTLWQLGTGFAESSTRHVFSCQSDGFERLLVRLFTFHSPPWQIVPDQCTDSLEDYQGVSINLLKEIHRRLRFKYTISCLNSTEKHITNNDSAIWDLSVEKLRTEEVDLLAYPIIVIHKRQQQVHLTSPFHQEAYTILSGKPKELSKMYIFFGPFKFEVWLLIPVVIVVLSTSLYFIQVVTEKKDISRQENNPYPRKWMDCFYYFYGTLSQQGMAFFSPCVSSRTLVGFWLLSIIIITAIYSGNLVAFLTIPRFTPQIKNLEDLIKAEGSISWGIPQTSSIFLTFSKSTADNKFRHILDHAIIHPDINSDVLEKVINGSHVIIDSKTSLMLLLKNLHNSSGRQSFVLGDDILFDKVSFAMRHTYPLHSKVDEIIDVVVATGLLRKWKSEIFPRIDYRPLKTLATNAEELSISLSYFQSSLYILGLGCISSIVFLLMEGLYTITKNYLK